MANGEFYNQIVAARDRLADAYVAFNQDNYRAAVLHLGKSEAHANRAKVIADDLKREQMRKGPLTGDGLPL